jgi:spoIIIJ-associated protein
MPSTSVEATGPDIEAAIARGLASLGVGRERVEVEVLEEPSRGVLGLGTHAARVRLTVHPDEAPAAAPQPPAPPESTGEAEARAACQVLTELLRRMGVRDAQVEACWSEPDPVDHQVSLLLNVKTADEDLLVGPRGETLEALQHITRLLVGHECAGVTRLFVDVNGHRARRKQVLSALALRLAQQALDTQRTVVLEPMPPDERRIVHLALRDHPAVRTESIGEGERRKVTIIPRSAR